MPHSQFLQTAIRAARAGEEIIRHYYRGDIGVRLKTDQTPVTVADIETEKAIKTILQTTFPEHGFYGEETGQNRADAEYVWLVDPIDGTKSFVRQYPFFSSQIALRRGERFIVGVSNAPLFGELAYAELGGGAFLNDRPVHVSAIQELSAATLSFGNIKTLATGRSWPALGVLIGQLNRTRGYGDFYHYHLLAAGKIEVVIESDINILDVAALSLLIQEAGGRVTDLQGRPLNLESTTILASNGYLHEPVLALLNS
ncbi:MAG: inositol monophosphatase family protein [Candidatus Competibacteraceae bacterium]